MLRNNAAFTVLELLTALALLAILFAFALPQLHHAADVFSVRAARDAVLGAAARARALAVARGEAQLLVDEPTATVAITTQAGGRRHSAFDLRQRYGVSMDIANSARTSALVEYDALGLGRFAALTVRLQRGSVVGGVTFSAYGRPRVW
jgi:prepilin-type N-terminal cleavage/methylation domain-containing protein